jgi:hypothetical protein
MAGLLAEPFDSRGLAEQFYILRRMASRLRRLLGKMGEWLYRRPAYDVCRDKGGEIEKEG